MYDEPLLAGRCGEIKQTTPDGIVWICISEPHEDATTINRYGNTVRTQRSDAHQFVPESKVAEFLGPALV